jgi:hypothetical protein
MLIPESDSQSRIVPAGVIVHTNASNGSIETLYNLYQRTTGEAHFQLEVAPPNGKGRLAQYIDTHTRADNNYRANSYTQNGMLKGWISIETADLGDPYTKSFSDLGQRQQLVDLRYGPLIRMGPGSAGTPCGATTSAAQVPASTVGSRRPTAPRASSTTRGRTPTGRSARALVRV